MGIVNAAGHLQRLHAAPTAAAKLDDVVADVARTVESTRATDAHAGAALVGRAPSHDDVQLRALFSRPAADLTRHEWTQLAAALDTGVDLAAPAKLAHLDAFDELVRLAADGRGTPLLGLQRYFTEWSWQNVPAYPAQLSIAMSEVIAGRADDAAFHLVETNAARMESLLASRPPHEHRAFSDALLERAGVASLMELVPQLTSLRRSLPTASELPEQLTPVLADTNRLIDLNLARLRGETPPDAVHGYGRHPDYAELGQVNANAALLQRVRTDVARAADAIDW